jgi:DNA repair protein RadA/Sms
MAKTRTIFVCQECGYESQKWLGKCPACNQWNSLVEEVLASDDRFQYTEKKVVVTKLEDIEIIDEERISCGIDELNRVLGGGVVKGSLVLVGGDPGIGKSTLLLQLCRTIKTNKPILYISGEESLKQIKLRADRLEVKNKNLYLVSETNLDSLLSDIEKLNPEIIILDSIQTAYNPRLTSAPGSVSQVRDVTLNMMNVAKTKDISIFIIGHVTKEGNIAGPRVLEHMVDCVLYFEGEKQQTYRVLRAVKNRFGSTNEIGVFDMQQKGLVEIINPSKLFLSGRPENVSGSCIICVLEGTRPVLAEIQALVSPTLFGLPRRMSAGVDYNRVTLLIAVLEKRYGLNLQNIDAYVNVVGGIKVSEPALDLGLIVAIASSFKDVIIPYKTLVFGEVGLTGEVRSVSYVEKRIKEANKLGFKTCILPKDNFNNLKDVDIGDIKLIGVKDVGEALEIISK